MKTQTFYRPLGNNQWLPVDGQPVTIKGQAHLKLFIHERAGQFEVCEARSGGCLSRGLTPRKATKNTADFIARHTPAGIQAHVDRCIRFNGLSPAAD